MFPSRFRPVIVDVPRESGEFGRIDEALQGVDSVVEIMVSQGHRGKGNRSHRIHDEMPAVAVGFPRSLEHVARAQDNGVIGILVDLRF